MKVILTSTRLDSDIVSIVVEDEKALVSTDHSIHLFYRGKECLGVRTDGDNASSHSIYGISSVGKLLLSHCSDNKIRLYSMMNLGLFILSGISYRLPYPH